MQHCLLSALGGRWKKVRLAMITVFVDDSGTSRSHKVAIASAIIVESRRIVGLDKEFGEMLVQEGFAKFHTSACVAGNEKEGFADWDLEKKKRVCARVRHLALQYGVSACSVAIERSLYDEIVPQQLREDLGKYHYTWAVGYLIQFLDRWAAVQRLNLPFEYVFDWMGEDKKNPAKREIEGVMSRAENTRPGFYEGHYFFRHSAEAPGLQCADILAWTCYQAALLEIAGIPMHVIAQDGWSEFAAHAPRGVKWLLAVVQKREQLQSWLDGELNR
jgi:hypothetical protein